MNIGAAKLIFIYRTIHLSVCLLFKLMHTALFVYSIDWIVAGLAAVPYLLFTDVNYIDQPMGSGNFLNESAFCALLDQNIYPKVKYIFM